MKTLQERIESLTFYGTNDEAYELFQATCRFAYLMWGYGGDNEKAELVVQWAEEQAAYNNAWAKADNPPFDNPESEQGVWG